MPSYSELWKQLRPFAIRDMRAIGTAGGTNTSTGGVATMESHELASPSGLGTYHTVTGLTAGQVIVATGATAARFAQLTHSQLTGVSADQHHAQVHSITGSDHTIGGADLDVVGNTVGGGLGLITPASNPGAVAALLKSDSAGGLTLEQFVATNYLRSPVINTAAGDMTISPAADLVITPGGGDVFLSNSKTLRTTTFASGFVGSGFQLDQGVTTAARTTLQLDDLWVRGRMHVYELLIHQIRATNGSILVANTGKIATRTLYSGTEGAVGSQYTLNTDSGQPHGFAVGDIIRAKRWAGGYDSYESNLEVTGVFTAYNFRAELNNGDAPQAGYEYVRLGSTTDASRRGGIYLTADDSGAPFIDVWNGVDAFADWNTAGVIKVRLGRLDGVTGGTNEYGLWAAGASAGDHLLISPTSGFELVAGNGVIQIDDANGIVLSSTTSYSASRTINFADGGTIFATLAGNTQGAGNILRLQVEDDSGGTTPELLLSAWRSGAGNASAILRATGTKIPEIKLLAQDGICYLTAANLVISGQSASDCSVDMNGPLVVHGTSEFDSTVAVGSAGDDISRFKTTGSNSVANDGTLYLGAQFTGIAFIFCPSDASVAIYAIDQGGTTFEIADPENLYTPTAGSASSTNVYVSGGGVYIQNKRGSTRIYHIMLFGTSGAF